MSEYKKNLTSYKKISFLLHKKIIENFPSFFYVKEKNIANLHFYKCFAKRDNEQVKFFAIFKPYRKALINLSY